MTTFLNNTFRRLQENSYRKNDSESQDFKNMTYKHPLKLAHNFTNFHSTTQNSDQSPISQHKYQQLPQTKYKQGKPKKSKLKKFITEKPRRESLRKENTGLQKSYSFIHQKKKFFKKVFRSHSQENHQRQTNSMSQKRQRMCSPPATLGLTQNASFNRSLRGSINYGCQQQFQTY